MATHYIEPGTVPIIVGAIYSRYPVNSNYTYFTQYRLGHVNETTGSARMHCIHSKHSFYVSLAELTSQWHLIRRV